MRTLQILVAICLVPTAIAAQPRSAQWPLDSGSRVRIQAPIFSEKTQQGTVVGTRGDTLHFRAWPRTTTTALGVRDITHIDLFQGTHSRKLMGTVIGFAIGAGLAAGISAATWKQSASFNFGRGGDAAFAGFFGGLAGGLVGLLVGAQERDTWVPVNLPNR